MNKKWLILPATVLVVFGLLMMGCPSGGGNNDDDDEDLTGGVETVAFDLQEYLKDVAVGETDRDKIFPKDSAASEAGNDSHVTFKIVGTAEKKGIEVTTIADWGAGFDLNYKVVGFREGDVIKVGGKVADNKTGVMLDVGIGGQEMPLDDWKSTADDAAGFEKEFTLTAAQVTKIKTIGKDIPAALRISVKAAKVVFTIDTLTVTGLREGEIEEPVEPPPPPPPEGYDPAFTFPSVGVTGTKKSLPAYDADGATKAVWEIGTDDYVFGAGTAVTLVIAVTDAPVGGTQIAWQYATNETGNNYGGWADATIFGDNGAATTDTAKGITWDATNKYIKISFTDTIEKFDDTTGKTGAEDKGPILPSATATGIKLIITYYGTGGIEALGVKGAAIYY